MIAYLLSLPIKSITHCQPLKLPGRVGLVEREPYQAYIYSILVGSLKSTHGQGGVLPI